VFITLAFYYLICANCTLLLPKAFFPSLATSLYHNLLLHVLAITSNAFLDKLQNCARRGSAEHFQNSRSHFSILGARRVACSKLHTADTQTVGATVQNLVSRATWLPEFLRHCFCVKFMKFLAFLTMRSYTSTFWVSITARMEVCWVVGRRDENHFLEHLGLPI
jgi:hypothetical protein